MNIDFELYCIFYVVANNTNITKASQELLIFQPTVTKSIKKLEDALGGQLFVRTKNRIGVSTTLAKNFLMPYLKDFHLLYPNIKIKINNSLITNLLEYLRRGTLYIVFFNLPYEEKMML